MSNGTSITENSVTQKHVIFTSRRTEYSRMQVPLDVVHRQMAPALVTIQPNQNHMVFTSRGNRLFLYTCTLDVVRHRMAPASVTIQLHQNRMLFTSGCNRIFLEAGAFLSKWHRHQ
jgi:hypothetical protein